MLQIDETVFFAYARRAPFGGRLTQSQIDGINCIFDACADGNVTDKRHVAYILATAFHETGGRMVPVREGFAKTDAQARKITAKYPYGQPDPKTGHAYYGRGHVQLTWAKNYQAMGVLLHLPLYENPDLALDPAISAQILVEGMALGDSNKGDFTGKSLEQYFNDTDNDPLGARRIVNGKDKAALIAGYYQNFLDAIQHAIDDYPPTDVQEKNAKPDSPNLMTDKTLMGGVGAIASSGMLGMFSAIDSPWAFAAFALLAVAVFLFLTGRLKIAYKAGA